MDPQFTDLVIFHGGGGGGGWKGGAFLNYSDTDLDPEIPSTKILKIKGGGGEGRGDF